MLSAFVQTDDVVEARVAFAAFDEADVVAVEAAVVRELFLERLRSSRSRRMTCPRTTFGCAAGTSSKLAAARIHFYTQMCVRTLNPFTWRWSDFACLMTLVGARVSWHARLLLCCSTTQMASLPGRCWLGWNGSCRRLVSSCCLMRAGHSSGGMKTWCDSRPSAR